MNDLTTNFPAVNSAVTMSSKEIAHLTGKRHDNVLRDIKDMLAHVHDFKDNSFSSYEENQGFSIEYDEHTKRISGIVLDKDHTLTLLTGYDAKARYKVIKRWQELESGESRQVQEINQAMQRMIDSLPAVVENAITKDPRVAAITAQSAKEVCDQLKVPAKGRGRLVHAVAHKLNAICVDRHEVVAKCPRSHVRLFPSRVVSEWIRGEGKAWVNEYLARDRGDPSQIVIPFPTVRREIEQ